jgi:hypothetical protein
MVWGWAAVARQGVMVSRSSLQCTGCLGVELVWGTASSRQWRWAMGRASYSHARHPLPFFLLDFSTRTPTGATLSGWIDAVSNVNTGPRNSTTRAYPAAKVGSESVFASVEPKQVLLLQNWDAAQGKRYWGWSGHGGGCGLSPDTGKLVDFCAHAGAAR